uniref:Uncharacterized protein n=1 Tax=Cannabis sativa TaxID=3483 RepID=A0A803PQX0_CANSA
MRRSTLPYLNFLEVEDSLPLQDSSGPRSNDAQVIPEWVLEGPIVDTDRPKGSQTTPPGDLDAVMKDVNPLSPEHTQPSKSRGGDASNADKQEANLNNQHNHIDEDRDVENEEEDYDGEYVKDVYYKDVYHYEQDPEVI